MSCDAKIRPMPDDTEISCVVEHQPHSLHLGELHDYAYPGSLTTIDWLEDDRRNFHGEWPGRCQKLLYAPGCVLPANHRGSCAT
jgi:hypothetical protein